MKALFTNIGQIKDRFFKEKRLNWLLYVSERGTGKPVRYGDHEGEDEDESWDVLESVITEPLKRGLFITLRVFKKGQQNHALTWTIQKDSTETATVNGIHGNHGIYGPEYIEERISEAIGKYQTEQRLAELEYENEQLRKGKGLQGIGNMILDRIPDERIGDVASVLADKLIGALFPDKTPISVTGLPPVTQPRQKKPQAPAAESKIIYDSERLLTVLEALRPKLGGTPEAVIATLEGLNRFSKENPVMFKNALSMITQG